MEPLKSEEKHKSFLKRSKQIIFPYHHIEQPQ